MPARIKITYWVYYHYIITVIAKLCSLLTAERIIDGYSLEQKFQTFSLKREKNGHFLEILLGMESINQTTNRQNFVLKANYL